jgi:AcrR family transcriptional regulator
MYRSPTHQLSTRDAILDAAGTLLGRFGYHKTTMDDLAREAGVARRTLYLHFRSKDEIFLARIDRVVERLIEQLRQLADGGGPSAALLHRMLVLRVMYRFDVVKDYWSSLDEIFQSLRKPYLERRQGYFASEAVVFSRVLHQGRERGEVHCDDTLATARDLVTATNALIPYSLSARELGARADVEREVMRLADLLVRGLQAEPLRKPNSPRTT